jgi:drug/metabolite transporter (DMT)-like permease
MTHARARLLLYGSFTAIYLVWGSSFVATKMMVTALPPYLAGGLRFLLAGLLLYAIARWRGQRVPRTRRDWRHIVVMACFHGIFSTGLNVIALVHVASNQSALLNASGALWITLLGTLGPHRHPLTRRVAAGVTVGFLGVGALLWPHDGFSFAHFGWQLVVLVACFSWALGTQYYRSVHTATPMLMFLALQLAVAGVVMGGFGLALGEAARWHADPRGLGALAYLVLFNSALAYTAYGYLTSRTTPAQLSTYAYVNPAIAALFGWLMLGEGMTGVQIGGMTVILAGVVLVSLPQDRAVVRDQTPAEPTG